MKNRYSLKWLFCRFTNAFPSIARSGQPNIITSMVDDLGWNHIGVEHEAMGTHGQQDVRQIAGN